MRPCSWGLAEGANVSYLPAHVREPDKSVSELAFSVTASVQPPSGRAVAREHARCIRFVRKLDPAGSNTISSEAEAIFYGYVCDSQMCAWNVLCLPCFEPAGMHPSCGLTWVSTLPCTGAST